ncbi:MAG: alanine--tRNA ligase [Candidatus Eisenbacteria bacterium]|nr:alanine--tRNA ligase [Candidatus Eisenbacteria bacterium]
MCPRIQEFSSSRLRGLFLDFFKDKDHTVVQSAPIVPDDPSLLFTTAGMVQFKPYYTLESEIPFSRAVSIQKCLRATDLENVGHTIRHHTFFEMLGNFSFGDYFKEEAISWAWEFVIDVLGLDKEKLFISVHMQDEEARKIWREKIGVPEPKIVGLGDEDNFWGPAGLTGACGPCSEIYIDLGEEKGCGKPDCGVGCDCDRFVEFWNLVFPEFYKDEKGKLSPLKRRGVDTGMGFERLVMICQGKSSSYETDIFLPVMRALEEKGSIDSGKAKIPMRIVADHARALVFAISEGILPTNEGRGYVLRRILRRAVRRGRDLGLKGPFLYELVGVIADSMGSIYPDLLRDPGKVSLVIKGEEERFRSTLDEGMGKLDALVETAKEKGERSLSGKEAFLLHDTYGFPIDLTVEICSEAGLSVREDEFEKEMALQRKRAQETGEFLQEKEERKVWKPWVLVSSGIATAFVGYTKLSQNVKVRRYREGEKGLPQIEAVLDKTPFYAEGGGQVGDCGRLIGPGIEVRIETARKEGDLLIHCGEFVRGEPKLLAAPGLVAEIDKNVRDAVKKNHTATHLLHTALRTVLGEHIRQSGSFVASDRLRFDFTHFSALSPEEINSVEDLVNEKIQENLLVKTSTTSLEGAKSQGALAFFGEVYGDTVRQVIVGEKDYVFSRELCAGTHASHTGEIGSFRIVSEKAVGSGLRRIEAVTGRAADEYLDEERNFLTELEDFLKVPRRELLDKVKALQLENDRLRKKLDALQGESALSIALKKLEEEPILVNGVRVLTAPVDAPDIDTLRIVGDGLREKMGRGVAILGSAISGKISIVIAVTDELLREGKITAGEIAKELGSRLGGGGGGRPHLALAGGKDPEKLAEGLETGRRLVEERLRAG